MTTAPTTGFYELIEHYADDHSESFLNVAADEAEACQQFNDVVLSAPEKLTDFDGSVSVYPRLELRYAYVAGAGLNTIDIAQRTASHKPAKKLTKFSQKVRAAIAATNSTIEG